MPMYKKILFPIDLSINIEKVIPHLKTIAEQFGSEVHLVYVATIAEYHQEYETEADEIKNESGEIITRKVSDYVKRHFSDINVSKIEVFKGEPGEVLISYVEEKEIEIVFMAYRGRSALNKAVFGSVFAGVLRNSKIPVICIQSENVL